MMRKSCIIPLFIIILWLVAWSAQAQRRVNYSADVSKFAKSIAPDAFRLIGNVKFTERTATMYCDSAYYYQETENIDAYGHIRIYPDNSGTTLTGKILHYDASQRIANITEEVVLESDSATLTTQTIFYDMNTGIATYPTKGTMISGRNTLVSDQGTYNKYLKQAYFKRHVVVTNPQYIIHTDTMNYNTVSKIVEFVGPTILNSPETDTVYCERGWHNTNTDISSFRQNAWIKSGSNIVKGDTLYYEKLTGLGKAFGNVEMRDTTQNIILRGDYASYSRPKKSGLMTKRALMIQVEQKTTKTDSLYLHGDSILYGTFTALKDTTYTIPDTFNFIKAYHHVKFFRSDLQGKCDSLYYSFKDSTLQFIGKPVIWAEGNQQLTAVHIRLFVKNKKIDKMEMTNSSFIISKEDSAMYNQIKGRDMTGYFVDNDLRKMYVNGNGQMIIFHKDSDGKDIMGVQKTESSNINVYFKKIKNDKNEEKSTLDKLTYINTVQGSFNPPNELKGPDLLLKDFIWLEQFRPKAWKEIFIWQ
jgi:lipopolysaccharide export system protein LptA